MPKKFVSPEVLIVWRKLVIRKDRPFFGVYDEISVKMTLHGHKPGQVSGSSRIFML
jgi:hypothetical protein